jgi:hypothetical protein
MPKRDNNFSVDFHSLSFYLQRNELNSNELRLTGKNVKEEGEIS